MNQQNLKQNSKGVKQAKNGQKPPQKDSPATEDFILEEIADGQIVGEEGVNRK